jgi:hypothetical protein
MRFVIQNERSREAVTEYIQKLNEAKRYEVFISLRREIRTIPQNRLYWLYLACISDEIGIDKDDLHVFFKQKYLQKEEVVINGETIIRTFSTAELNTKQFTEYINKITVFASSEWGIALPDPADICWEQFYETYRYKL